MNDIDEYDSNLDDELIETTSHTKGKKKFFDGNRRPTGKWMLIASLVFMLALIVVLLSFFKDGAESSPSNVKEIKVQIAPSDTVVGGSASSFYNQKVEEQNIIKEKSAETAGKSYIPTPIGNSNISNLDTLEKKPEQERQKYQLSQEDAQFYQAVVQSMGEQLKAVLQKSNDFVGQENIVVRKKEEEKEIVKKNNEIPSEIKITQQTKTLPDSVVPGKIYYAVNKLTYNSRNNITIFTADITHGPLKGYKATGAFEKGDQYSEKLGIKVNKLISPSGEEYPVVAYGIDPATQEAAVASDVDHEYLSRWGTFMAASFLTGFANATQSSGITGTSGTGFTNNGQGNVLTNIGTISVPRYNLTDKAIIGIGQTGAQVASELKQGINRPPIITFDAQTPVGILIVSRTGS